MQARTIVTTGVFLLMLAFGLVGYTLISYLSLFLSETSAGLAIAGGFIFAGAVFLYLPSLVARHGAQRVAVALAFIIMFMLMTVAGTPATPISVLLIVLSLALQPLLYYCLDLLLEATFDGDSVAGRVRSFFLTGANIGTVMAPLIIGTLLGGTNSYTTVFFAAAIMLLLFIVLFSTRLLPKSAPPALYHMRDTLIHIARHRDLAAVTVGHFILYLFFMWTMYVPAYLHGALGIPWSTLGWVFAVALIPYVLVEYPAGWLADTYLGDKEMMLAGFAITGIAFAAIGSISTTTTLAVILPILVVTRVGAALVESMTEGHFFRRVAHQDIVSMSVFRGVWPLANIAAPLIGSIIFSFDGFHYFFLITGGLIAVGGVATALLIDDFR